MTISVVCPVLNEAPGIQKLIDFFVTALPADKELFLIDGGSSDATVSIIEHNMSRYENIRLLNNPHRIVPYALNLAIPLCTGRYIVRLDGHSVYSSDYFEKILETFSKTDAAIVGGPTRTHYESQSQEAIAYAVSHPFGIGGSKVHDEEYEGYTDSVTFGAWKREIFDSLKGFDVRLVRNQDDEFHYRAKSVGFKIYQNPEIKLYYQPRDSLTRLFRQYFQYGLYKPLVLKKIKSEIKLRHLVPSGLVLYLAGVLLFFWKMIYFIPLAFYFAGLVYAAFANRKPILVKFRILLALPCIHIAYGSGFIVGLFKEIR